MEKIRRGLYLAVDDRRLKKKKKEWGKEDRVELGYEKVPYISILLV
jgi:hypothetical protein